MLSSIIFVFQLFDNGAKGYISEQELCDILDRAFGMDQSSVGKIFAQIEKKNEDHITFGILHFSQTNLSMIFFQYLVEHV